MARLTHLSDVTLSGNHLFLDSGLTTLSSKCTRLQRVDLNYCGGITGAGVTSLVKNCSLIQELNLKGTPIDEAAIVAVGKNLRDNLRHIELQQCNVNQVTDTAIQGLALHACNLIRLNVIGMESFPSLFSSHAPFLSS